MTNLVGNVCFCHSLSFHTAWVYNTLSLYTWTLHNIWAWFIPPSWSVCAVSVYFSTQCCGMCTNIMIHILTAAFSPATYKVHDYITLHTSVHTYKRLVNTLSCRHWMCSLACPFEPSLSRTWMSQKTWFCKDLAPKCTSAFFRTTSCSGT